MLHGVIDWNDLRYLLAIAKARTLAGAARELGVEHTTVGRRLGALETAVGTRLFVRGGSDGFVPTEAALAILPLAGEVAAKIAEIERVVSGVDRIEGTVRVTTSEALSGYLVKRLGALRLVHPNLIVEILAGNRAFDLMRGEADLAVRMRETTDPDLLTRRLGTLGWSMYATPSYVERKGPLASPEDLTGPDVIDFDAKLASAPGRQWLEAHGKGANVVTRVGTIVAAYNAALVGAGLTVIPCFLGDADSALVRLTPRVLGSGDAFLVFRSDLATVARVRAVIDFLVAAAAEDAGTWAGNVASP